MSFTTGSFVSDFLHISGGDIRNAKSSNTILHGLVHAYPTARARLEGFRPLESRARHSPTWHMAASRSTTPCSSRRPATTVGSSFYTAEAVKPMSTFNGKPIAWRYADPSPTPRQGAVAMTSFALHRMKIGAVSHEVGGVRVPGTGMNGLVEVMAAWFRAHDATRAAMARPEIERARHRVRARY